MSSAITTRMHSSCPLCAATELKALWEVDGYSIAKCPACTLVFVRNQLTIEELAAYYAGFEDDSYGDENVECLNYYYNKLGDLIRKRFPQPGKLLDIGCSRGWFLDTMQGWECHGNEITTHYGKTAQAKHGDRIFIGSFEDYPMREGYFDVITLQDVFDHIRDPQPTLEKCRKLLKPGGLIAIKVHNISCLYAQLTGSKFYAIIPPSHLFYYDKTTLALTLQKAGFEVTDTKFIGHLFKVKTIFHRLSKGDLKSGMHRLYENLNGTTLGELKFTKNLHDIITVVAIRP